jgi:hypothetical protein
MWVDRWANITSYLCTSCIEHMQIYYYLWYSSNVRQSDNYWPSEILTLCFTFNTSFCNQTKFEYSRKKLSSNITVISYIQNFIQHSSLSVNSVTNSMEQSPSWETNSHSASQEIAHLAWKWKLHYCVHKSQLLVPNLSMLTPYIDKITGDHQCRFWHNW